MKTNRQYNTPSPQPYMLACLSYVKDEKGLCLQYALFHADRAFSTPSALCLAKLNYKCKSHRTWSAATVSVINNPLLEAR